MSLTNPQNFTQNVQRLLQIASTGHRAIGHQILTLSTGAAFGLTVPDEARYALIRIEEVGGANTAKIARFWEDGGIPSSTEGIAVGDMTTWDIVSYSNLIDFRIAKVTAGNHILFIQYYS